MGQTLTVGTRATRISQHGDNTIISYHSTPVVTFDSKWILLNTGGWFTPTTKVRMNQASNQFDLKYHVYQKDFTWYVTTPQGEHCEFKGDTFGFPRS